MSLKEQRYICTLADCGSITEAAKQLFITQPALSMYVSNTEKAIGVQLFDRSGKSFKLTYAGEQYVNNARKMIELQDTLEHKLTDIRDNVSGRVRIGLQRRRSGFFTVKILKQLKELHPDVELEFFLGDRGPLVDRYERNMLDILINNSPDDLEGADGGEVLLDEKVLLVVSEDNPVMSSAVTLPGEKYPWIDIHKVQGNFILTPHTSSLRFDVDTLCRKTGYKINDYMEIGHTDTCMQIAAEGLGISFSRESYAEQFVYSKQPVFFMIGDPIFTSPLRMRYKQQLLEKPYFLDLLNIIRACVK